MTLDKIAIIGVGRMGLCFALNLDQIGYEVLGIDINQAYVSALNERSFQSAEPGVAKALANAQHFRASSEWADLAAFEPDMVFVAVDTATA